MDTFSYAVYHCYRSSLTDRIGGDWRAVVAAVIAAAAAAAACAAVRSE